VAEVFLGFRRKDVGHSLDGFGFLVPGKEKRKILGTIWSSAIFGGRAPAGHVAMTSFIGGARSPGLTDLSDADLHSEVLRELEKILGIKGDPVVTSITRWRKAIPQYELGYETVLESMDECENQNPGLFFCGNFKGGIAVGDCIMNSEKTAGRVREYVMRRTKGKIPVELDKERHIR
jgi:oxygen-dependent protoporphyrinogen oxidase